MLPNAAYAFIDMYEDPAVEQTKEQQELEDIQQFFFERPINRAEVKTNEVRDFNPGTAEFSGDTIRDHGGMPMVKQLRIKLTNHFKIKAHEERLEQKAIEAEVLKELQADYNDEKSLDELQEENLQNLIDIKTKEKRKEKKKPSSLFKRNKKEKNELKLINKKEKTDEDKEKEVSDTESKSDETIQIQGGVKQVEAEKDAVLDCQVVNYLDDSGEIEALGRPVLVFPTQGVKIVADRLTYNSITNVMKAFDNVEVTRNGSTMYGDFLQINMNEENALITNLKTKQMNMTIYAETANAADDLVVLEKGKMVSEESYILRLQTQFLKVRIDQMVIPEAAQSHLNELVGNTQVKVIAKNIKVTAKDEHDVIVIKNGKVQFEDSKLFNFKSLTVHTNKNHDFVEMNIPEFGSRSRIGMFAGPGFVFDAPFGSTIKVMPLLNYKDDFGFGGALRYTSATNRTDMMYGSAKDVFVLRGKQYLDDKLLFQYGVNSYMNDWWMGQRMAKYLAEVVYMDGARIPDFLGKRRALTFRNRVSAGYMHDSDVNRFDEKINSSMMGTTRFKYMASITQSLYSYHNRDKRMHLDAGVALQGSAAVYGTGDTQFIGRVGPYLHTQYKYWMQDIGYFQSTYSDNTPLPRFDTYRYGKSNVYLREALRINKYVTIAYATSLNLSDDAPNGKQFQENAFIVALGPDDFKVSFGYDFMREQTYFTLAMALDTKGSSIEYDKMEIVHPEKLGRDNKKYVKPVVFPDEMPNKKPAKLKYAQIINIEDPNKEQI